MTTIEELVLNSKGSVVTEQKIKYWFDILNDGVFSNELILPESIVVSRMCGYRGWCNIYEDNIDVPILNEILTLRTYEFKLHNKMDFEEFLDVLAHEMVHLYQAQILNDYDLPEPEEKKGKKVFSKFQKRLDDFGIRVI